MDKGNVARINTQGATVDGEFKKDVRYPNAKAEPAKNFETEIPSFEIYDGHTLTNQLISKKVEITAEPINDGRGFLTNLFLGFGPVILLVGCSSGSRGARRAGRWARSGPSGARGRGGSRATRR